VIPDRGRQSGTVMTRPTREGEIVGLGWALTPTVQDGGLAVRQGMAHLRQAVFVILTTRKGERLMRPWFGSDLWRWLDMPINQATLAGMRAEIFDAVDQEPRLTLTKIVISSEVPGWLRFDLYLVLDKAIAVAVSISYNRELARWEGAA